MNISDHDASGGASPAARTAAPPPMPLPAPALAEIRALALRWKKANGPVMTLLTRFGGRIEHQLPALPKAMTQRIEEITARALESSYSLARQGRRLPGSGDYGTTAAALTAGLAGGAAGLPGAIAELPFTITVLLHAIRREAVKAGFDPEDPWIMAEALRTFGSGSPMAADDGVNTALFSARATLTGPALHGLISSVAPKLATALGQKLAAQAVPVLGALSGAAINTAFLRYYRELAAIRFALLRLSQSHGATPVLEHFADAAGQPRIVRA